MSASPVCHFCHNPMQIIVVPTDDGPSLFVSRCIDCDNIVPIEPPPVTDLWCEGFSFEDFESSWSDEAPS